MQMILVLQDLGEKTIPLFFASQLASAEAIAKVISTIAKTEEY